MGGIGSGGHNRTSDAEKLRKYGRVRKGRTEADWADKAGQKVVVGPWLSDVPDPDLPFGAIGSRKYQEVARALFEQGKLTMSTKMLAEQIALLHEQMHSLLADGKRVPTNMSEKLSRFVVQLGIAENAAQIAKPQREAGKFALSGFANRRPAKV